MNEDVKIDLNYLTEDERDIILSVIRRDDDFRKQEKERIRRLKDDLEKLRQPETDVVSSDSQSSQLCSICLQDLGFLYFFTSGLCPKCQRRTCKQCRKELKDSWQCHRCDQLRSIKAQSGAWFYEKVNAGGKNKIYGSTLIRASLRRSKGSDKKYSAGDIIHHDLQPLSEENNVFESVPSADLDDIAHDEGVESISEGESESLHGSEWRNNNENQTDRHLSNGFSTVTKQTSLDSEGGDSLSSGIFTPSTQEDSVSLNSPGGEVTGATSEPESDQHVEHKYHREVEQYPQINEPELYPEYQEEEEELREEDLGNSFSRYTGSMDSLDVKDRLSMGSRESIVSTYSNAGDNIHCPVPVTGEVFFGVKYDFKKSAFEVQIHRAQGLAAVDTKRNRSDPYIKTYLLPDRTKSGKRKTKVRKHTVNPEFDEILQYKVSYDDLLLRTLWLTVWNSDRFGHNAFLGEVLLSIEQYMDAGYVLDDPTPQWYPLHERQSHEYMEGDLPLNITDDNEPLVRYHGEVLVALKFVPPEFIIPSKKNKKKHNNGQLHVHIKEAKNLIPKDDNGLSDPFCKIYFLPDKRKSKQKTPVIKKTVHPTWNYQFMYDNVTWEELKSRGLELTVWDYDMGSSNDFLGGSRLGLGTGSYQDDDARDEEVSLWRAIIDKPNQWAEKLVSLRASMEHRIQ